VLTQGEIQALQGALFSYVAFIDATKAARAQLGLFSLPGEYDRFNRIVDEQIANLARFKGLRNDLINEEPSDHERVLQVVMDIRALTGSDALQVAMRREAVSNDAANIAIEVVEKTAKQAAGVLTIGIGGAVIVLFALLYFKR
jgi:hypothetical protein